MAALIFRRVCFPILLFLLIFAPWIGELALDGHAQTASKLSTVRTAIPFNQPLRFERFTLEDGFSQNTVFIVKAANNNGVWNETGPVIPLQISPPAWQTWWFLVGVGLLVFGVLAIGYMLRVRSIQGQKRELENQVAQRTEELRQVKEDLAKHAEEELQLSAARFGAVFENAAIGIALVGLDRRPLELNAAMVRMSGYSREEMLNMTGWELVYSEDRDIGMPEYQEMLEGKRESSQVEKRYVRKDGSPYWVRLTTSVVRKPDGTPIYLVAMSEDIDQQKHVQEALRESEARFRAMFDNVAVGMALMTLDRKVLKVNQTASRIIGYSVEEAPMLNPSELAIPEDRLLDRDLFQELIAGQRDEYQMEKRYLRKDGRIFWGRVSYSLVRTVDGQPQYLIGVIEDIDEQKRAAEKLATQETEYRLMLEQRVAERTAELRLSNEQLQNAIQQRERAETALAQKAAGDAVAADRSRLARDLHDAVTQTLFSASLLAEVIPQLWDINPTEARKRLAELRELTRGALAEMRTLLLELRPSALTDAALPDLLRQLSEAIIGRARLPIQLSVDGDCCLPPEVQVAFYRIAQEALNNVVKYAKATQVGVNLRLQPDSVRLSVMDNGIGFDPAAIPPNHLGLRIMHERADAIGARVSVYSEPGAGTQVTVLWNQPNGGDS